MKRLVVAPMVAIFALSGCSILGVASSPEKVAENTKILADTVAGLEDSGELPEGVTFGETRYEDMLNPSRTVTIELTVPETVSLPEVVEIVDRAVWQSEITPLGEIRLRVRDYTKSERVEIAADSDPMPDIEEYALNSVVLDWDTEDPHAGYASGPYEDYLALTERWGERPVDD